MTDRIDRIDLSNVAALARGCAILGAGGGGDTSYGELMARQAIGDFGSVPLVQLEDLADDALLMPCGGIGAPTVSIEKIENGEEGVRLRDRVEELWGRPVAALFCGEIGGSNGIIPVVWAARLGLPVVDADGMGRAFPEVQQVAMHVAGLSPNPGVMTDERGNVIVFRAITGEWMERLERAASIEFGGMASSTEYQMTALQARTASVIGSMSLAIRIGTVILEAQEDPVAALAEELRAAVLIVGKVADIERRTTGGFVRGSVTLQGLGADAGRTLRIEIQNENLVAEEGERVLATVPDIITMLDSESGRGVQTERIRYGQRVAILAFPCDPVWRSERGLEVAGPRAFGYDLDYVPIERLRPAGLRG